jgi:FtsP/CotA-like multicopper oxidase with cupredoxin domain
MSDDRDRDRVDRREFLKLGTMGAAFIASGCSTTPEAAPPSGPSGPGQNGPPSAPGPNGPPQAGGPGGGGPPPPDISDLVHPPDVPETWLEPWIWRPEEWDGTALDLNVVRNQNPGGSPSPGNRAPSLFSFNGMPMGPTVRVKGDGNVRFRVRNMLGLNEHLTPVGAGADPLEMPVDTVQRICDVVGPDAVPGPGGGAIPCLTPLYPEAVQEVLAEEVHPGWRLKGHLNGPARTHTTNLHTHGLHVRPERNADGSHSDNVMLRILPKADWEARRNSGDPELAELGPHEHVGQLDYDIQLPIPGPDGSLPHPPGTHWYHPHSHGATHNQVASGMAGFLIVEGDVDEAVNLRMTGEVWPDPEEKTGPWDYRERLVLLQRVFLGSVDLDAGPRRPNLRFPPANAVNGVMPAAVITMRPGAVERWRILNGSVDGSGTKRLMVLEGQYVVGPQARMYRVDVVEPPEDAEPDPGAELERNLVPVSYLELEAMKADLAQLSFDGITLVAEEDGQVRHVVRDLSRQNAGTENPMNRQQRPGESFFEAQNAAVEDCYRDGDAVRNAYVRPNELFLTNANRADVFFRAPRDAAGKIFTVFAMEPDIHTDHWQSAMQTGIGDQFPGPVVRRTPARLVLAYVHVRGEPVEGEDFDLTTIGDDLPPVPPLFQPVRAEELRVPAAEAARTGARPSAMRTRTIAYTGTGSTDWPLIYPPEEFCDANPHLKDRIWATQDGVELLCPPRTRSMAINTEFDLSDGREPGAPHKFGPDDPKMSRVLVDTAEEWVLYNTSMTLWSHTDLERFPQAGQHVLHFVGHPMTRGEGQRRFHEDPEFKITNKANDHPFHIHINPMWVMRIEVPDENGVLHNVLPEPRWMDTVWIPRDGGRVVFRTRFDDYTGVWVHHCHILLHEDNGMMQAMECTDDASKVNYRTRQRVASHDMDSAEVDRIYPRPTLEQMYRQNFSYVDPCRIGGHEFPGFELPIPEFED